MHACQCAGPSLDVGERELSLQDQRNKRIVICFIRCQDPWEG